MAVKYPTDWDINQYYDETEPRQHWELRREFMVKHKGQFSEDYLVSLGRTFINIEMMGCVYPVEVMDRIAHMSEDIAAAYRDSKKYKLQRTFVSAKDAAETKYGGNRPNPNIDANQHLQKFSSMNL
ncbi:PREDICTED: uncharacterized protein LOC108568863 [Nicrophorus vespilloides]|uniref:Uncharacterized protein LOC108568863 n=1 Tax=Nicrophorus vespilloides TaxID=110193 RepID=A0ABM1NFU8_NICVS|nr:PREDICTED: uncharacterized protein LOC108568863 [Nicrophorus vespilloides]XP_017785698.1 PREDICTED: uncharacterized protein LOC108568863 [Nicrophorus vespilloides]XP_017785699.1 PREDICTED: uncharacterized protein LOC108568863 [Nicrophorus vespilloides]